MCTDCIPDTFRLRMAMTDARVPGRLSRPGSFFTPCILPPLMKVLLLPAGGRFFPFKPR